MSGEAAQRRHRRHVHNCAAAALNQFRDAVRQQRNVPSRSSDIVWCHTDISTSVTGASWAIGVPRIHAELKVQGLHVGHKRVARLISRSDSEYREILANSRKN